MSRSQPQSSTTRFSFRPSDLRTLGLIATLHCLKCVGNKHSQSTESLHFHWFSVHISDCMCANPNLTPNTLISIYPLSFKMMPYSLVAQLVKNPPVMQETWVRFLGWEDLLEKGMATHSSILAWRIPWTV